jgi:hypothetical protein
MSELNLFQKLFKRKSVATTEDAALMPNFESTKTAESVYNIRYCYSRE